MEIIRAKHMGFCFGVLEAINVCNSLVEEKGRKYMELIVDFSSDLTNEKYNEFIDTLYENNHLENYIKKVLELEEIESDRPLYLSLLLTDNKNIQVINREYRDKDAPTDVISFAYHETEDFNIGPYDTLGDIIISLERVEEQASEYNHSFEREFYYVLTHGILHILGYDHIEEEDKKLSDEKYQEKIINGLVNGIEKYLKSN